MLHRQLALLIFAALSALGVCETTAGVEMTLYHNNTQLVEEIDTLVNSYPALARKYVVGNTVEGRDLVVLHISVGGDRERPLLRPMVKLIANMHGNEAVGREVLLALSRYLLQNYDRNTRISSLLDEVDLHLLPSLNPDGFEHSSPGDCDGYHQVSGRHNLKGVDLNRAFPTWDNMNQTKEQMKKNREPEVSAMIDWILGNPFVLSANLHDGAVVANYPWDDSKGWEGEESLTPDDATFKSLAEVYANSHQLMHQGNGICNDDNFPGGITNGAKWYVVSGGMQDFNYIFSNCMEITLELSCCKFPPEKDLPGLWDQNRESLVKYLEIALGGVRGVVRDSQGLSVADAEIQIEGITKTMTTTSRGEYWRILAPGVYRIRAEKMDSVSSWNDFEIKSMNSRDPVRLDLVLDKFLEVPESGGQVPSTTSEESSVAEVVDNSLSRQVANLILSLDKSVQDWTSWGWSIIQGSQTSRVNSATWSSTVV